MFPPVPVKSPRLSRSLLAVAISHGLLAIGLPARAQSGEPAPAIAPQVHTLPAGPLEPALNRLGRDAGVLISFPTDLTAGVRTEGADGARGVEDALRQLLRGTGIDALPQAAGGFILVRRQDRSKPGDRAAATELAAAVVTASAPRLYDTPDVNAGALGTREMQNVPFAIGSYTVDTVQSQRARTALDVLKNDPSVSAVTYAASFDGVAVRGFSANTFNNVRRDGLLANVYSDVPLENKERIDVLKGVSGFLYGVGDPSGLVNYVTKRPTRDPLLSLTGEVRTQDGRYLAIDAGRPVAQTPVGYRFNAAKEQVGDFSHPGDLRREFVSGAVDARLAPDLLLQVDFDYQEKSQSANASLGPRSDGTLVPASSVDPRTLIGQSWGRYKSRSWNMGSRLEYDLNADWSVTGQVGHGTTKRNALFNNVYEVAPNGDVLAGGISYEGEDYLVTSGQVFTSGRFATGALRHELVAGYSYSKMNYPEGPYTRLPDTIGNIHQPNVVPDPGLPGDTNLPRAYSVQHSLFASDTVALTERWSLLLGARVIDYKNDKPVNYPDDGPRSIYAATETVPTVSVLFKPAAHTTVYGTYTKGFEQGAYAPGTASNAGERLDPIISTQYEVGVKSSVHEGLLLTAALFDIAKPLQSVFGNVFMTKGRQRHRGLELAASGTLTPQLSGIVGMAWLDASQEDTGDTSVDGRRPANVARFQANAFIDYRVAQVPGLSVNTGYYLMGNRPLDAANTVMVDRFGRWDAGAAYTMRLAGQPSVIRLAVQNVTDERYWESVVYGTVGPAQPRTVRLSLTTQF